MISEAERIRRLKFSKAALRHGQTRTPEHNCWLQMRYRCSNPNHPNYADYGGRGITVCERWNSFENFLADMGKRPFLKATIERKDNNKGYSPDNCTWATHSQQLSNTRRSIRITFTGHTKCLKEWCRIIGRSYRLAMQRIHREGWTPEKALLEPVNKIPLWRKQQLRQS